MTVTVLPRALAVARPQVRLAAPPTWVVAILGYLAVGAYVDLILHAMHGDAYSRVANAYYVLFSREPHLAAMGFVWSPLPSIVELMLVPLKLVWPPMTELGFAAVLMSATFMGLAVREVDLILRGWGTNTWHRRLLVGAFAAHPAILYYGAIGTSEAPTLFFLLLSVRGLTRWMATRETATLVTLGMGLAGAYLTRYEAVPAAAGAAVAVVAIGYWRTAGTRRDRVTAAAADALVALTPFLVTFVGWAIASWVIVGTPFTQFTSEYGNSSQIKVWAAAGANEFLVPLLPSIGLAGLRLVALDALFPLALVLALVAIARRGDLRALGVGIVLGPLLAFMVVAYVVHVLAPWLRYYITVIPLTTLLVAIAISPASNADESVGLHSLLVRSGRLPRGLLDALKRIAGAYRRAGRPVRGLAYASLLTIVLVGSVAAIPVAAAGLLNPTVAAEESRDIGGLLSDARADPAHRTAAALHGFDTERDVASYLDDLRLPAGSVLLDVFSGFSIEMQSRRPQQFVITPDRDFKRVLADPVTFGVKYLLMPDPSGNGTLDALNRQWPVSSIPDSFARLERTFPGVGTSSSWYLYRLVLPTPAN